MQRKTGSDFKSSAVYNTGTAYVIFPEYRTVEHVSGDRPSKSDESITWRSGAAFQHEISLGFSHDNIDGDHADSGQFYESPYNYDIFAAFTFADGRFSFSFDQPSQAVRAAAEAGGSGFMQFGLIRDGEARHAHRGRKSPLLQGPGGAERLSLHN